jgi:hypothetical protein
MLNLPDKKDFMKGGIFAKTILTKKKLPVELMSFIFPDYTEILFKQKPPPGKLTLKHVTEYCISLQKQAKTEERDQRLKTKKDMEIKILEDNIKEYFNNYYKNLYKNCTCLKEIQ